jgi:predicted dienelactone hydrolase
MKRLSLTIRHLAAFTFGVAALVSAAHAVTLDELKKDGPYAITPQALKGSGFASGTIYSPNTAGQYAVIAVSPGFVSAESTMSETAKRIATHGFVVVTIATKTTLDFPPSRGTQLLAALKAAIAETTGPVRGKIDAARRMVLGHSMGGGGALEAAAADPTLKASLPFAPWSITGSKYKTITIPTAIFGGSVDTVAPVDSYARKFYNAIPTTTPKLLGVVAGADHTFPHSPVEPASYTSISWAKRYGDANAQYSPFLNGQDAGWSLFLSNGPF